MKKNEVKCASKDLRPIHSATSHFQISKTSCGVGLQVVSIICANIFALNWFLVENFTGSLNSNFELLLWPYIKL